MLSNPENSPGPVSTLTPEIADPTEIAHANEIQALAGPSVDLVRKWLRVSAEAKGSGKVTAHPSAERLAAVLSDSNGLDFTVGFVDRVIRTDDTRAAAHALAELGAITPASLSALDKAQIRAGAALGTLAPAVVIPLAKSRMRAMVGHMVIDARPEPFGKAIRSLTADGNRLNINLLGEAVLGEDEADHHLAETARLLARDDVDYVSIKVSSIASQLSMWAFEDTVDYVLDRLRPLYRGAAAAPAGSKFINLDMEEYRDLELTLEVFTRLLSEPEFMGLEAGIVLQAYLPDALGAMQRLAAFATDRVNAGGAGIKVRLVKGANLAMERVHAEVADWPLTTCPSKQATDANYKLVLHWLFTQERMRGLRIGVAGHNLFDIAFAHLLADARGVSGRVEFEMLQGMASEQAYAVRQDVGDLLVYVPAVRPQEFDVAISYLVRRLEENSTGDNFMSGIFDLANGNEVFQREERRFRDSLGDLEGILAAGDDAAPAANRTQSRGEAYRSDQALTSGFVNEPDTDPSLPANQAWAAEVIEASTRPDVFAGLDLHEQLTEGSVAALVEETRAAAEAWAARPARERAEILMRAADLLAERRGRLITVAAAEAGKSVEQSDPEVSEAVDFARYYAHRALELDTVDAARFTPDAVTLVTPPWNFPLAIPTGSTVAALAAGSAVIHKPSAPTPFCSAALVEALWDAGVPREVLRLVAPVEGEVGKALVSHPGVDRVILTGASETAAMFRSWRPELNVNAETSGKNALVITPAADRDLAVADLVHSAFGHAGQKCSAASLAIMVGSTYGSERYRRQLVDAARSMVVDWPQNLSAAVGPLTESPSEKLQRALTSLEPGESWLLEPMPLDDTGRLWSPGIKDGVRPGSFFHLTEVFGPVLGLMRADSLQEAIDLQNAVDFGLTAGIHSLDPREVERWVETVEAGNLYVNRGITGAIVQRQPFGGWKKSSVGLGSKAGGPNYLMQLGTWSPAEGSLAHGSTPEDSPLLALAEAALSAADNAWVRSAAASDQHAWETEFGVAHDPTGLRAEANIFRYRPRPVTVRTSADTAPKELLRVLLAAERAGSEVTVVPSTESSAALTEVLHLVPGDVAAPLSDAAFAAALRDGEFDDTVGARVRVLGPVAPALLGASAARPEVALLRDAVTASGRVELRHWVSEQAISITLHRFGNPSGDFQALAARLRGRD